MKKMPTLFKIKYKDKNHKIITTLKQVDWIDEPKVVATIKFDGTAVALFGNKVFKRLDLKPGRTLPPNLTAYECSPADPITGHHPYWIECDPSDPSNKYVFEGFSNTADLKQQDWTYELCGPKVNGNPENLSKHILIPHGIPMLCAPKPNLIDIFECLVSRPSQEGIVFWRNSGLNSDKCKIRRKDFNSEYCNINDIDLAVWNKLHKDKIIVKDSKIQQAVAALNTFAQIGFVAADYKGPLVYFGFNPLMLPLVKLWKLFFQENS